MVTRTYTITDICGNDESCEQIITLSDEIVPTMTCPTGLDRYCEDGPGLTYTTFAEFTAAGGAAADNCGIDETSFALFSETTELTEHCASYYYTDCRILFCITTCIYIMHSLIKVEKIRCHHLPIL